LKGLSMKNEIFTCCIKKIEIFTKNTAIHNHS
jgi:hypothetical protein